MTSQVASGGTPTQDDAVASSPRAVFGSVSAAGVYTPPASTMLGTGTPSGTTVLVGGPSGYPEWGAAPAAPGGVAGSVVVTVDFGFDGVGGGEDGTATTTVTGQTWAASLATMTYLCVLDASTFDHESPAEEGTVEGLVAAVQSVVPGVGFDLVVSAPRGTWGEWSYRVVGLSL